MMNRGVSRPSSSMPHPHGKDDHSEMPLEKRREMNQQHHAQTLWVYWLLILLGLWLLFSPLTFTYDIGNAILKRDVWLSFPMRVIAMKWSDVVSGILLIFFGWRSLTPDRPASIWICCFIGIWLSFAPLLFWAPSMAIYINDTIVGVFVIGLSVLIPGMPNMIIFMKMGSETPNGWSYNPSSWPQRWIMIVTGFFGWMVSRYLAAYQMGYSTTAFDPFFGHATIEVLNSSMSRDLPISDAGLGSLAYTFEFLMGFMGSPSRWRTMPWMVLFFGILVIPLGLVHIVLVISQPLVVGAWCSFCILAALIMLPMIPLEADEVVAMGQHMVEATRRGEKFWSVFWKGGISHSMNEDKRSPKLITLSHSPGKVFLSSIWGMSFPWNLTLSMLLGILLMTLPGIFSIPITTSTADVYHLIGALVIVIAVVAMGEVLRIVRILNILFGIAIAIIPWFTDKALLLLNLSGAVVGLLIVLLSFRSGIKKETYGLWDKYVR